MSMLNYVTDYGIITVDVSQIKTDVENEYKAVFGDDLDTSAATPQGRLIEAETAARANMLEVLAYICNQINPNEATGQYLDSLCALTGCVRKQATRSSVIATLTGVAGTIIPANSEATTINGDVFYLENEATIGGEGTVDARFLSQETGPIPCAAGELTSINTDVLGWETIINNTAANLGSDIESDEELRARRRTTLYNGRSLSGDVLAALSNIDNIESVFLMVNNGTDPLIKRGVTIQPNTLYTCVLGGTNQEIANALYMRNSAGCGYTGNTQVTVNDPWSGVDYTVKFERPTIRYIDVKVYLQKDTGTGDITSAVTSAIMQYQYGKAGNLKQLDIGDTVSPFEISSAITQMVSGVFVKEVQIAFHGEQLQTQNLDININEIARFNETDIKVRYE